MAPWLVPFSTVATAVQTPENQLGEVKAAGFDVQPRRIVTETISGSTAADQRPAFHRLVDRLEAGDVLVVTKLDRLGRNAMDVRATVDARTALGEFGTSRQTIMRAHSCDDRQIGSTNQTSQTAMPQPTPHRSRRRQTASRNRAYSGKREAITPPLTALSKHP